MRISVLLQWVCACVLATTLLTSCGGGGSSSIPTTTSDNGGGGSGSGGGGGGSTGNPILLSDLEYGQGSTSTGSIPLLLDIHQPSDSCDANRPTVFFVHGGAFVSGSKSGGLHLERAQAANDKGFNYVSINYRLVGNNPVLSSTYQQIVDDVLALVQDPNVDTSIVTAAVAAMEDAVAALNWLEINANQYCLDMTRLAYWGSSAGAYTVLNVAYTSDEYGITRPDPDVVINYWGDLIRDGDLEFMEAPFLTIHGDQDATVPYSAATELATQADAVGVPYSFYTEVGGGHGVNTNRTVNGVSLLDLTLNFIEAHIVGGSPLYETANVE